VTLEYKYQRGGKCHVVCSRAWKQTNAVGWCQQASNRRVVTRVLLRASWQCCRSQNSNMCVCVMVETANLYCAHVWFTLILEVSCLSSTIFGMLLHKTVQHLDTLGRSRVHAAKRMNRYRLHGLLSRWRVIVGSGASVLLRSLQRWRCGSRGM
jgi:hypothetical protein